MSHYKKIRTNDFKMPTVDILTAESVGTIEDCPGQRKQQDYSLWRLWWGWGRQLDQSLAPSRLAPPAHDKCYKVSEVDVI